ncbi:hypothetical protein Tco_1324322, partial [Tanacetum coccineum]
MGWVVQSDAVLRSCDAVLDIVVTASRVICDAVSSFRGEILEQCWCRSVVLSMGIECGFLSQKGNGGRGVNEKNLNRNKTNNALGIGVSTESDNTVNEDTPVGVASAVNEGVTPSVIDMTVKMEKQ